MNLATGIDSPLRRFRTQPLPFSSVARPPTQGVRSEVPRSLFDVLPGSAAVVGVDVDGMQDGPRTPRRDRPQCFEKGRDRLAGPVSPDLVIVLVEIKAGSLPVKLPAARFRWRAIDRGPAALDANAKDRLRVRVAWFRLCCRDLGAPKVACPPPDRCLSAGSGSAMEPGGIEPPCRSGPLDASTRVAVDLHSVRARPRQAGLVPIPQKLLTPSSGRTPSAPARCFRSPRHRASQGERAA